MPLLPCSLVLDKHQPLLCSNFKETALQPCLSSSRCRNNDGGIVQKLLQFLHSARRFVLHSSTLTFFQVAQNKQGAGLSLLNSSGFVDASEHISTRIADTSLREASRSTKRSTRLKSTPLTLLSQVGRAKHLSRLALKTFYRNLLRELLAFDLSGIKVSPAQARSCSSLAGLAWSSTTPRYDEGNRNQTEEDGGKDHISLILTRRGKAQLTTQHRAGSDFPPPELAPWPFLANDLPPNHLRQSSGYFHPGSTLLGLPPREQISRRGAATLRARQNGE